MKKIAVVCALPPERNVGMATVDLAAHSVLAELLRGHQVTLYALGKGGPQSFPPGELPFSYTDIRDNPEAFLASDVFVYWGDFIHARAYWELDHAWKPAEEIAALKAEVGRYFFLSEMPTERLKTAILFGGTIITNSGSDGLDREYSARLARLLGHASGVYFRDALSAAKASPFRKAEASLGCDCALLLKDEDLDAFPGYLAPRQRQGIGVFFGRSPSPLRMLALSRLIGRELGEECNWIPWFKSYGRMRLKGRLLGYDIPPAQPSTSELLMQLAACKFVVTDTYHVCVNAWRFGIPAICIGAGATTSAHSLSDKKKEVFFEMYGARDYYVFLEELTAGNIRNVAQRAAAALANQRLAAQVTASIAAHRRASFERLQAAVGAALAEDAPRPVLVAAK